MIKLKNKLNTCAFGITIQEVNVSSDVQIRILPVIGKTQMGSLHTNFGNTAILKFVIPTVHNPIRLWSGRRVTKYRTHTQNSFGSVRQMGVNSPYA